MTTRPPGTGDPTVEVAIYRYSLDFETPIPRTKIKTLINKKNTAGNLYDVHSESPTKIKFRATNAFPPRAYIHTSYIHTKIISKILISNVRWYPVDPGYYTIGEGPPNNCSGECESTSDCDNGCVCVDGRCVSTKKRVIFNAILASEYHTVWDKVNLLELEMPGRDSYINQPLTFHPYKIGQVLGKLEGPPSTEDWIGNPFIYTDTNPFVISVSNLKESLFMVMQFTINVRDIVSREDIVCPAINCVWVYDDVLNF